MPTILTHAVVAAGIGRALTGPRPTPWLFWVLSAALAMAPDLDVVALAAGIPYTSVWSHRGVSHSLCAAALAGLVTARLTCRPLAMRFGPLAAYFFLVTASHGVLDAFTDGGEGVAFFAPVETTRYFSPWRPVRVSPLGRYFFSRRGVRVLASEILWIWLPTALLLGLGGLWRWWHRRTGTEVRRSWGFGPGVRRR
jgi:inner membrane protein